MNVAFIPVRGGSKSIPMKNIREINGKPLVYWVTKAANECRSIDKIYISTDSEIIKETVESFKMEKVEVIGRSEESASDTASTECAMLEFAQQYDFDNIVLIQATSPLLKALDLERGFKIYGENGTDSVLSVVRQKRFHWNIDENENAVAENYDIYHRPRRQEFAGYFVENGAFYITGKNNLLASKNRISGNIKVCEMPEESFFEIDEPSDFVIIEQLMKRRENKLKGIDLSKIKLVATDCDGVLTDTGMYYGESGEELKKFSTLDGMGFELLRNTGIKTAIITAERNQLVVRRGTKLNVDEVIMGAKDKLAALKGLCQKYAISLDECAYIGDDVFDLEAILKCGYGCVPSSAFERIKQMADYVTERAGGNGCFREVADIILEGRK